MGGGGGKGGKGEKGRKVLGHDMPNMREALLERQLVWIFNIFLWTATPLWLKRGEGEGGGRRGEEGREGGVKRGKRGERRERKAVAPFPLFSLMFPPFFPPRSPLFAKALPPFFPPPRAIRAVPSLGRIAPKSKIDFRSQYVQSTHSEQFEFVLCPLF